MIPTITPILMHKENEKIICPFCKNKFMIEEVENEKEDWTDVLLYNLALFLIFVSAIVVFVALVIMLPDMIKDVTELSKYFIK